VLISVDYSVLISQGQCKKLGRRLIELQPNTEDFLDSRLFPSPTYEPEDIAHFFFFVTGIDHRTSPPNQSFEGIVDGEHFQGADLLWHLSLRKFKANPQWFHPATMAQITNETIAEWFTVTSPKEVTVRNPAERAVLLRNSGQLLLDKYQGSLFNLLSTANHRVTSDFKNVSPGLLELLSQFKAYEDPVKKKSYLLLKFLLRRNLWSIRDSDEVRIPVDNHLTRIALRTGIVKVSTEFAIHLREQQPLSLKTDVALRKTVGDAYSYVGKFVKRSVLELDDFFWHFGRQCCLRADPICVTGCTTSCYVVEQLIKVSCQGRCPLSSICLASTNDAKRALVEPKLETWYY